MMKVKSYLFALCCIFLSGCVTAVVVGAASIIVYDRRSLVTMESDARIFHVVNKAIVSDPRFYDSRIVVSSFNRVVLLTGQTPAASLRVIAEKVAQGTPNVLRVYNEITIDEPISLAQQSKDSWITSQIRSKMLTRKGLESGSIRIVTENGAVYLMGIVSHGQADRAVDIARHVHGVKRVVKIFQYFA